MADNHKRISTKGLSKEYDFKRYPRGFGIVFRAYVQGAIRRDIDFTLTTREVYTLMSKPCHYCGLLPYNQTLELVYNGIDRVRADGSYTINNVVACCKLCNRMKSALTIEDFLNHISLIHSYNEEDFSD